MKRPTNFHVGPMDRLYDLVFSMVESRWGPETRERFAAWTDSVKPTTAHLAVMLMEMALSGTPMGSDHAILLGFGPDGEPLIKVHPCS